MGNVSVVNRTSKAVIFELWQVSALYSVELGPGEEWGYDVGAVHFTVYARYSAEIAGCFNQRGWYFKGRNYLEISEWSNEDKLYLAVNRVVPQPPPLTEKGDTYHRWVRVWSKTGYKVNWMVLDEGMLTRHCEHFKCTMALENARIVEYNDCVYTIQSRSNSTNGQVWFCQSSTTNELTQWRTALEFAGAKYERRDQTISMSTGVKVALGIGLAAGVVGGAALGAVAAPVLLVGAGVAEMALVGAAAGAAGGAAVGGALLAKSKHSE